MEYEKIYKKIKDKLMGKPEVLAIFNNGSSVVGMNSTNSDLDFVIVIKNEKDEKKLRNILRKSFKITLNEKNPEIQVEEQYWILNKRADFTIISKKKIEEKINKFYKSPENFLELQHFIKHKIVDSISIYDPKKLLLKWKKQVEKYPKQVIKKLRKLSPLMN
jgi:predicted nucleotidyltransferase